MRSYPTRSIILLTICIPIVAGNFHQTQILYNQPQSLPDGLLITGGVETRSQEAVWTALVTLETPKPNPDLRARINYFRKIVRTLETMKGSSNTTRTAWEKRLDDIEDAMLPHVAGSAHRTRRGLLNIVGQISRKLFGTATEEEVEECQRQIQQLSSANNRFSHAVDKLVTLVNQTHKHMTENRHHILALERYLGKVQHVIQGIEKATSTRDSEIALLNLETRIDRALASLETAHNQWIRQLEKHHRQRASLELGWLTEEILPIPELRRICDEGRRAGFYAPPVQWYYEHVHIQPLWEDETRLVFKAELPFSAKTEYLRYYLWTWPVPGNTSQFRAKLQVPDDIAFHTESGGIFRPTQCRGNRPAICSTGPIYDRSRLQCPRGLITGEEDLRKHCKVTIYKPANELTDIQEINPGVFVISTLGENCSLHCSGATERRLYFNSGVFLLTLQEGCGLRGKGWTVSSVSRKRLGVSVRLPIIPIPPMDLAGSLPAKIRLPQLSSPQWEQLGEVRDLSMNDLAILSEDSGWEPNIKYVSWTGFSFGSIALGCVLGILACHILRKFCNNHDYAQCNFKPKKVGMPRQVIVTANPQEGDGTPQVSLTQSFKRQPMPTPWCPPKPIRITRDPKQQQQP